ncbi:hypothetical protein NQ665_01950 [Acinetobacter baumannii]|nr:hypothetical protein [Acinetobacter baumannii]
MLPTKKNLMFVSIFSLSIALVLYYYFYVYIQKSSSNFCQKNYCLEIIPISDFLSITIGVIGVIALIISLDTWKIQEKYKQENDFYTSLINNLKELLHQLNSIHPSSRTFGDFENLLKIQWKCKEQLESINLQSESYENDIGIFILFCLENDHNALDYVENFMLRNTKARIGIQNMLNYIKESHSKIK